jgi:hypothetical protein
MNSIQEFDLRKKNICICIRSICLYPICFRHWLLPSALAGCKVVLHSSDRASLIFIACASWLRSSLYVVDDVAGLAFPPLCLLLADMISVWVSNSRYIQFKIPLDGTTKTFAWSLADVPSLSHKQKIMKAWRSLMPGYVWWPLVRDPHILFLQVQEMNRMQPPGDRCDWWIAYASICQITTRLGSSRMKH